MPEIRIIYEMLSVHDNLSKKYDDYGLKHKQNRGYLLQGNTMIQQ